MGYNTEISDAEQLQYIFNDYKNGIEHGVLVANLTYQLAKRMGLSEEECYMILENLNYQNTYMAEIQWNYRLKR